MSQIKQLDHIGVTVADLDLVTAFFVDLGLEIEGRTFVEGEFIDKVIGIPDSKSEIVMVRPPGGGCGVELARFVRPDHTPGSPDAPPTQLGVRSICFEVEDLKAIIERVGVNGYHPIGEVGDYENTWSMAHVRGPEGIVVALTERIG